MLSLRASPLTLLIVIDTLIPFPSTPQAYHQLTKDTAWLSQHYKILSQWSTFLVSDGLIPAKQLSTDDFAGTLANQTDLAIKAIIGIGAMAEIAKVTGHVEHGAVFRNISEDYVGKWIGYSISPDRTHTKLAYQDEHSWGTLYNLFAVSYRVLKKVSFDRKQ